MAGNDAFIWFIAMTLTFFAMLAVGTFLAVHTYDRGRGAVDFHLRRHRH
jgi:hypothetical protein